MAASLTAPAVYVLLAYGQSLMVSPFAILFFLCAAIVFGSPATAPFAGLAIWVGGRAGRRYTQSRSPAIWCAIGASAGGLLGPAVDPAPGSSPLAGIGAGAATGLVARRLVSWSEG